MITCTILLYGNFHTITYVCASRGLIIIYSGMIVLITITSIKKNEELPGVTHLYRQVNIT